MPAIERDQVRPRQGYLFVEPVYEDNASPFILIPDTSVEKHSASGWIVAVSGGDDGLNAGDFVIFQPWKAIVVPLGEGASIYYKEQLYVLAEGDIEAVLEWEWDNAR
jgi:co-chaperonin GroES (HSP10)